MSSVSVIIPTYNRADLLEAAVRSCLGQTHPVHEVLVCDDGSTDGSRTRMEAIRDKRVKWIDGPRAGRPAVPRNRGIQAATGEWTAFLDSDDAWKPEKLRTQLQRLAGTDFRMSCTNAERIVPGEGSKGTYFHHHRDPLRLKDLLAVNPVICSSALVKTELLTRSSRFPEAEELRSIEDYALWLRLMAWTEIQYCPEPLVLYRDEPASSIRGKTMTVADQRDRVFTTLRASKEFELFDRKDRLAIIRNLRAARRTNGRPFFDWFFIR